MEPSWEVWLGRSPDLWREKSGTGDGDQAQDSATSQGNVCEGNSVAKRVRRKCPVSQGRRESKGMKMNVLKWAKDQKWSGLGVFFRRPPKRWL